MVTEVDCVGDAEGLSFGVNDAVAAVMLEGDTNAVSVRATKVHNAAGVWFVVDDDGAAKWQERGGIVVKGAIEVGPG